MGTDTDVFLCHVYVLLMDCLLAMFGQLQFISIYLLFSISIFGTCPPCSECVVGTGRIVGVVKRWLVF